MRQFTAAALLLFVASMLVVLSASGCGSRGEADPGMVVETLDSGVVRVTHPRLPERHLRVDTLAVWDLWDEGVDYLFNRISWAEGVRGGFYLMDLGNKEVVRVDMNGDPLFNFGRAGQGPGEFEFPFSMSIAGGRLWIPDMTNYRFSIYELDGGYVRDIRWSGYRWFGDGFRLLPDGRVIYSVSGDISFDEAGRKPPTHSLLAYDPEAGEADTLVTMPGLHHKTITVSSASGTSFTFVAPPQFAPYLKWAYAGDGRLLTVTGTGYLIEERDLEGRKYREICVDTPELIVTQRHKDWFFDEEGLRFGMVSGEVFTATRASLQGYPFAEHRQAVEGIQVDPHGRIWVQANTDDPSSFRMDIFDSEGQFLGNAGDMPMPIAFTPDGYALLHIRNGEDLDGYYVISVPVPGIP